MRRALASSARSKSRRALSNGSSAAILRHRVARAIAAVAVAETAITARAITAMGITARAIALSCAPSNRVNQALRRSFADEPPRASGLGQSLRKEERL